MHDNSVGAGDLPEAQTLMAAIIRLMARSAGAPEIMRIRTLVNLLGKLRAHPELSRQPAVRAGLAEAHSLMLERLSQVAAHAACRGPAGEDGGRLH